MEIAVTGLGMITAVGNDARATCAAIRAGIARPRELPSMVVLDTETCEESLVVGHPVEGYSEGFALAGAWVRLALGCLDDLARSASLPAPEDATFWARTGLLVVTPAHLVRRFGEGADDDAALRAAYLERLLELWGRPIPPASAALVSGGKAGVVVAVEQARAALTGQVADRVIVLAADSYLDDLSLSWLSEAARLKSEENPVGLAPGEAAAAFLLELEPAARRRRARVEAFVSSVAAAREERAFLAGETSQGEALGDAIRRCLLEAGGGSAFDGDLVSDLTGEAWRANELACATVRALDLVRGARWVHPASSLGDTGAASGVISVCVAARALARGYARGRRALVVASSEDGLVGAVQVTAVKGGA